jgi:uncharacterized RmlC-like cupin family protein
MNTPQTSGMTRAAAITHAKDGATSLWAGTMVAQPRPASARRIKKDRRTGALRRAQKTLHVEGEASAVHGQLLSLAPSLAPSVLPLAELKFLEVAQATPL